MLFNSLTFVVFFIITLLLYWHFFSRYQNMVLLISSYIFYAWWDWRFLILLVAYSCVDYLLGKRIYNTVNESIRKRYLILSVVFSLLLLGFFKYFNFFVDSLVSGLASIGMPEISLGTLGIILPIGISFYVFKSMSYTIDIYRKTTIPTDKLSDYMTYLAFFPQIAAGPIERASDFLSQLKKHREFFYSRAVDGLRQILWGFFKKIVIADSLAIIVNRTFNNPESFSGGELLLAVIFFAFQIYADFSGYSDIAIGLSKLLGFQSIKNFEYPYFSRSITEFWRRWHISLSSWLRDYCYYPIIFSRKRKTKIIIYASTMITFLLVGLWHGAGWNFIIMGGIFGLYVIGESIITELKRH